MSAKEQAIKDIKAELKSKGKDFIAFRKSLNGYMDNLVNNQIKAQQCGYFHAPQKQYCQLVARCTVDERGRIKYESYLKYYGKVQNR